MSTKTMIHLTPSKQIQKKYASRKSLPLPILSLQTNNTPMTDLYQHKKAKQSKSPIRQNFKKMLELISQNKQKQTFAPNPILNETFHRSKQIFRKRLKTNFQLYNQKVNCIILKTHIISTLQKIQSKKSILKTQMQNNQTFTKSIVPNFRKTIRLISRSNRKPAVQKQKQSRFMKWENFCTSIPYNRKTLQNMPLLRIKKTFPQRSNIKDRSKSTLSNRNEELNGWQDGPVRYVTDYHTDLNDMYL